MDRPAGTDGDRGLNAEAAVNGPPTGFVDRVGCSAADGAFDIAVLTWAEFSADAEEGGQTGRRKDLVPVMVGSVFEARLA
jgi:hypothetical protein